MARLGKQEKMVTVAEPTDIEVPTEQETPIDQPVAERESVNA